MKPFSGCLAQKLGLYIIVATSVLMPVYPKVSAQTVSGQGEFFSPINAQIFHKIAYEIYKQPDLTGNQIDQAITLLQAAMELDPGAEYIYDDVLHLSSQLTSRNYSNAMLWAFTRYVDQNSDLEVTKRAVSYMLAGLNTREEKEATLTRLLKTVEEKNAFLSSQLATQLAILLAEKADSQSATNYLMYAYNNDPYNELAFTKLGEFLKKSNQPLSNDIYAKQLRRIMGARPHDINKALPFARYTDSLGLYDTSASAYKYAAELFNYLNPKQPLPPTIYLPWAIVNYNAPKGMVRSLEITRRVRQSGRTDIVLEGIAAKAAQKMQDKAQAQQIQKIITYAENALTDNGSFQDVTPEQIAWFYCFAQENAQKALAWANSAYSKDKNSDSIKAIMAYALVMNDQMDLAEPFATESQNKNQIAALTVAVIQLAKEKK